MKAQARLWIFDLTDHQTIYTIKQGGTYYGQNEKG